MEKTRLCSCCGRKIAPYENSVNFPCPNCGDVTIWRCEACRDRGKTYKCLKCEFVGP